MGFERELRPGFGEFLKGGAGEAELFGNGWRFGAKLLFEFEDDREVWSRS